MNETISLADGTQIDVSTGKIVRQSSVTSITVPTNSEAQKLVTAARRKVSDLPALPATMTPIAAVLSYSLFGLEDAEIAIALTLPIDQVVRIKMMPEYDSMLAAVCEQIMQAETANIRNVFTQKSKKAAETMVDIMENSDSDMMKITAAKDVLDRAGHRPADMVIEQRSRNESELRIKFVKEDRTSPLPVIDITPNQGAQP